MARHSAKHAKPSRIAARPAARQIGCVVAGVVGVCMLLLALGVYVARGGFRARAAGLTRATAQAVASAPATAAVDSSATPVEVPTLTGLGLDEAKLVLKVRRTGSRRQA